MQDYSFNEYFDRFPLAMAYVPWQHLSSIFEDLEAPYSLNWKNLLQEGDA